jgi:hypothetical protein
MDEWSDDIEKLLYEVRQNCITLNKYHLLRYYKYKQSLPFFKLPVLVLSAVNSVFSVGLQPYMQQSLISVLNCIVSLIITLINSIELYMGIQKSMESEMLSSQGYYILSIDIYKTISLKRENRDIAGKQYLTECYNKYEELIKKSKLIKDTSLPDMLQSINNKMIEMYNDKCIIINTVDNVNNIDVNKYELEYLVKDINYYDIIDIESPQSNLIMNTTNNIVQNNNNEEHEIRNNDTNLMNNYMNTSTSTIANNNNISEDNELLFPTNVIK